MAVIRPTTPQGTKNTAGKIREGVKWVMIFEVVVCILHMMVFDIMSGFTHAISVWIDFMAYSTMHWCQTIILVISGALDLGMLVMAWTRSDAYKAVIYSHWLSKISFWFFIVFYVVKLCVSILAFIVWRNDYRRTHGHTNCCTPVVPPYVSDTQGGSGAPLVNHADEETGMRQVSSFQGSGTQIGAGGGGSRPLPWASSAAAPAANVSNNDRDARRNAWTRNR